MMAFLGALPAVIDHTPLASQVPFSKDTPKYCFQSLELLFSEVFTAIVLDNQAHKHHDAYPDAQDVPDGGGKLDRHELREASLPDAVLQAAQQ